MPLSNDPDNIIANATPEQENRLTRTPHPESSLESSMASKRSQSNLGTAGIPSARADTPDAHAMWQLEYRARGDSSPAFKPVYQFTEQEYFPPDFAAMHFTKMHRPYDDVFWDDVVAVRYVVAESMGDEDDNGLAHRTEEDGCVSSAVERPLVRVSMFRGVIRWRVGGRVLRSLELNSEEERVEALEKFFGTIVAREDIKHILGQPAAL
ncbi:hypothetical protein M0805_000677 [Coniferiporia weirii]|nr:hypothetical protein M0805_000677 [Coniferiporia weirii]